MIKKIINLSELYAPSVLRYAMAAVILWFSLSQFMNASQWTAYVPDSIASMTGLSSLTLVYLNATFELIFGTLLVFGIQTRIVALLLAAHLFDIMYMVGYGQIGIRDFGLAIATLVVSMNGSDILCLQNKKEELSMSQPYKYFAQVIFGFIVILGISLLTIFTNKNKSSTSLENGTPLDVSSSPLSKTPILKASTNTATKNILTSKPGPKPASTSGVPVTTAIPTPPPIDTPKKSVLTYKNGTYTATGSYMSPGGIDQLLVTLTLKNDIITSVSVTPQASDQTSSRYQILFMSGYKPLVLGKNISGLNLSKVSGSSLTPKGFNDALAQIRNKAKA